MADKAAKPAKKVVRAEKAKGGGISDVTRESHMQLFHHLIAAGPTMHGKPGERKKKTH